jgi:DNA-binding NarL/FixJ family response regulator
MSIRIAIVDDHELFLQGLKSLLQKQNGFEVVGEAGNGKDAIELISRIKPDVLVLDVEMPDMDGIATARDLIAIHEDLKILALSIHDERDYVTAMINAGASGYILKDSAVEELKFAIRRVMNGHQYLSPDLVDVVLESIRDPEAAAGAKATDVLTDREKEILILIAEGNSTKEIAFKLDLSVKTIDAHRQRIMNKLAIHSIAELTRVAIKDGLIEI